MDSIVGFTLLDQLAPERVEVALAAQRRVVESFPHLRRMSLTVGQSRLELWGHGRLSTRVTRLDDGSVLALVGSPHGRVSWSDLPADMSRVDYEDEFALPWDGRVVLIRIGADGRRWTIWNDWVGSIPVFHTQIDRGRSASTLEPVVVAAAGFSADDIFLPALVSLLINGHCLSDWTLYRGMRTMPPDSVLEWSEDACRSRQLWTVAPSPDRWETGWDELIDELHELSRQAIAETIRTSSTWVLPLSAGLDSRLIAGVAAGLDADLHACAWGHRDSVDVFYSREIARALGIPWTHVDLGTDYLVKFTRPWAAWFGSSLHFHGMYQMAFFEAIEGGPPGPSVTGFLGDVLTGSGGLQIDPAAGRLYDEWYTHWTTEEVRACLKVPLEEPLAFVAAELERQANDLPGAPFQRGVLIELWSRCRLFTSFQATLADYWRGVGAPFLSRAFARFCLSLPLAALGGRRRLLADTFCRKHGRLATIPGTYGEDPFILTGRYLLKRRLARSLPAALLMGPLRGFRRVEPRMDIECVQANGWKALWPVDEARDRLAEWLDVSKLDEAYAAIMSSKGDVRPLRKLQSVQALACCLLDR